MCFWRLTSIFQGKLLYFYIDFKPVPKSNFDILFNSFCLNILNILFNSAVDWVMMQSCYGQHFMLVLEKQEKSDGQHFFAIVQLIGSRKHAEKFAYRLELNGTRKRMTWEVLHKFVYFVINDINQVVPNLII